jgi:hypothetical protein
LFFWGPQGSDDHVGGGGGGGSDLPAIAPQTYQITIAEDGTLVSMRTGDNTIFMLGNESHSLAIGSMSGVSVSFALSSALQTFTLSLGDSKRFDLDENGKIDLVVKLVGIANSTASVLLTNNELKSIEITTPDTGRNVVAPSTTEPLAVTSTPPPIEPAAEQLVIPPENISKKYSFPWLWSGLSMLILCLLAFFYINLKKKSQKAPSKKK